MLLLRTAAAAAIIVSVAGLLTLPSHIASGMVIQRGRNLTLWGLDTVGAVVTVEYQSQKLVSAPADAAGRFFVVLPSAPASSVPTTIALTSTTGSAVTLTDVLVGDVYVCSGQRWALHIFPTLLAVNSYSK